MTSIYGDESAQLKRIAASFGADIGDLMRDYLKHQADGMMRGLFATVTRDGKIRRAEWDFLLTVMRDLGLSRSELLPAIKMQAECFVEHALAEAKADGILSPQETDSLYWLLDNIILDMQFSTYVTTEIRRLEQLQLIESGTLPTIASRQLGIRAGELVHAEVRAKYYRTRQLRNGPLTSVFDGILTLTDYRLMFAAAEMGVEVNHRRVIGIDVLRGGFELRASGKGAGTYGVAGDHELIGAIYCAAVKRANQTLVSSPSDSSTRHIPREVRQRIWQRYGGRCADCGADQYLEYDHIVPVARGGSNSDANVQLLCRRCNLKKSDAI